MVTPPWIQTLRGIVAQELGSVKTHGEATGGKRGPGIRADRGIYAEMVWVRVA